MKNMEKTIITLLFYGTENKKKIKEKEEEGHEEKEKREKVQ